MCVIHLQSGKQLQAISEALLQGHKVNHPQICGHVQHGRHNTTQGWHSMVKWNWREQCSVYGEWFRGRMRSFSLFQWLLRQKNTQSPSVFLIRYIISEAKQVQLVHCCCVSVHFIGNGVFHKHEENSCDPIITHILAGKMWHSFGQKREARRLNVNVSLSENLWRLRSWLQPYCLRDLVTKDCLWSLAMHS